MIPQIRQRKKKNGWKRYHALTRRRRRRDWIRRRGSPPWRRCGRRLPAWPSPPWTVSEGDPHLPRPLYSQTKQRAEEESSREVFSFTLRLKINLSSLSLPMKSFLSRNSSVAREGGCASPWRRRHKAQSWQRTILCHWTSKQSNLVVVSSQKNKTNRTSEIYRLSFAWNLFFLI